MKRWVSIIATITLVVSSISYTPKMVDAAVLSSAGSSSWNLVWSDEFDQAVGGGVDSSVWNYSTGASGWGNNEVQNYVTDTDNVRIVSMSDAVDGKALAITAKRESDGSITSGRLNTQNKQYVTFGKIEARIRTENGMDNGVWPAFWMMGNDHDQGSAWPHCGETDIMEHRNAETQVISTLHWNPNADGTYAHVYYGSETSGNFGKIDSMDSWHTYGVEWYQDHMYFLLDGVVYNKIAISDEMKEEFLEPQYILLNLAIGSTSTPFTLNTTVDADWTESTMYVDYVRVYQGTDSSFTRAMSSDTSGVVTTEAPETTASPATGMTLCTSNAWTSAGNVWDYNIGTSWANAVAYYTGGSQNDFSIYMDTASNSNWGAMIRANQSVTAGHSYEYAINYTSNQAGSLLVKEDVSATGDQTVNIVNGSGTITGSFTAGDSQTTAQILMDLRGISAGTKLNITGLTLTDTTTDIEEPSEEESSNTSSDTGSNSDYSGLTFTEVTDTDIAIAAGGDEFGFQTITMLADGRLQIIPNIASGTKPIWPDFSNATWNGGDASAVYSNGAALYISSNSMIDNSYNVFEATSAVDGHTFQIIVRKGNPSDSGEEESTTEEPSKEEETTTVVETTDKPAAPLGLTYAGNDALPYYFAWQAVADAVSYNVYVNNNLVSNVIGGSCNIDSANFTTAGIYTIGVTAVNASGTESDMTTTTYTVKSGEEAETTTEAPSVEPEETTTVAPLSSLAAPVDVEVFNFYAQEKGYRIDFEEVEDAASYNVYIDGSGVLTNISGTESYINANVFGDYADDGLHSVYLTTVDSEGKESAKSDGANIRITSLTNSNADPADITRIYVVTNDGTKGGSTITKADKTPASLTIISGEDVINTVFDGGTIKRRGNSTSLADKPAYNISFNSKKEVIKGAAKGKKWSLLANAFDKTLMRSKLAMDLGTALGGVATPMQKYADLYIDGEYQGSYLISEPADNDRSGIAIDDSDEGIEMMFEMEVERVEDGQTYYTTPLGVRFVTTEPEGLDTSTTRYTKWVNTLTTFETALQNTSSDEVFNYIDMESFVDMYIANELFKTVDFGYSSVKYYVTYDADGNATINAGCLWDFDLSSGNSTFADIRSHEGLRGQEVNTWFRYLMQNATFKNAVIAKYTEMQPTIQNIYKANELGDSQINQLLDYMGASKDRNYAAKSAGGAGWSETTVDSAENKYYPYSYGTIAPYNTYTYDQHIEFLTDWLENRNIWLCDTWGINYDYETPSITVSDDLDITGWQMSGSVNGVDGCMGIRTIYQVEDTVEGQEVEEVGLVYGLIYGDNPITEDDMVYDSDSTYVASYAATNVGIMNQVMGDSQTATYYLRTMICTSEDGLTNQSADGYTTNYYIRVYAKLADGSIAYSNVYTYNIFDVADYIYQNNLATTKTTYDHLYNKILHYVDSTYKEGDFDWAGTIV